MAVCLRAAWRYVKHLQDTIEALKRAIVRNPKSDEYRKALKGTGERLTIAKHF